MQHQHMRRHVMPCTASTLQSFSSSASSSAAQMQPETGASASASAAGTPRGTRICCTIGPASEKPEPLQRVLHAGMSVMRCNFSHGQYDEQGARVDALRTHLDSAWRRHVVEAGGHGVSEREHGLCAIAVDLKGREVRTGMHKAGGKLQLTAGDEIVLHTSENMRCEGSKSDIFVDYPLLSHAVMCPGGDVYIDDGLIRLEAMEAIDDTRLRCKVKTGGLLGERKGVNLPGAKLDLPAITEYDRSVLRWAAERQVDAVFASFVESAEDVRGLRDFLSELGPDGEAMMIFSKIESARGVDALPEIVEESDGVLVARGDLGIEVPVEDVPWMQKLMIHTCNSVGKPVICATQMMESMEKKSRPTRAEASDVANAVIDGSDLVMLSGETANGDHPELVVETMAKIAAKTEAMMRAPENAMGPGGSVSISVPMLAGAGGAADRSRAAMVAAAAAAAGNAESLLILPAITGGFASEVAKLRPNAKILVPTTSRRVANQMLMRRGAMPLLLSADAVQSRCAGDDSKPVVEKAMVDLAFEWAIQKGIVVGGQDAVAVVATGDGAPRILSMKV